MLMALNKASHRNISRQFQDRKVSKRYLARVYGKPNTETGSVDLPLICDWLNSICLANHKHKIECQFAKSKWYWLVTVTVAADF